jgi:hypothetical protein
VAVVDLLLQAGVPVDATDHKVNNKIEIKI